MPKFQKCKKVYGCVGVCSVLVSSITFVCKTKCKEIEKKVKKSKQENFGAFGPKNAKLKNLPWVPVRLPWVPARLACLAECFNNTRHSTTYIGHSTT